METNDYLLIGFALLWIVAIAWMLRSSHKENERIALRNQQRKADRLKKGRQRSL